MQSVGVGVSVHFVAYLVQVLLAAAAAAAADVCCPLWLP